MSCDLKNTLKLAPDARAVWLEKVLIAIPKGKAKPQEVFDIVTHRKFVSGVPEELGVKMLRNVKESLVFFSEKQQLNIAKCKLVKEFKPADPSRKHAKKKHDGDGEDEDEGDKASSDDDPADRSNRRHFTEADAGRDEERRREVSEARSGDAGAEKDLKEKNGDNSPIPGLSPEERAKIEREYAERERERQRKREEELKRIEAERKAHEERERQRKAKIGSAFLVGGEEEDEVVQQPISLRPPPVEKKLEDRLRVDDEGLGYSLRLQVASASSSSLLATSASTSSAIQTMGGDSIVNEAQQILQRGAGQFLDKSPARGRGKKGSRSRGDHRRSRSRRRGRSRSRSISRSRKAKGEDRRRRVYDSLRSPTPDGHLRGQMRAARKAKMMAQMLQQGNVPRVA